MKKLIPLIIGLLFITTACNTIKNTGPKVMASTALAVDAAMKSWAVWVVNGHATPAQEQNIRDVYKKYQVSMLIAYNAYTQSVNSGNDSAWKIASTMLDSNKNQLISLVQMFMANKNTVLAPNTTPESALDSLPPAPPTK